MPATDLLSRATTRGAAVVLVLAVALGGGLALGHAVGPSPRAAVEDPAPVVLSPPGGRDAGDAGVSVELAQGILPAGAGTVAFTLRDAAGEPIREVEVRHDKPLHLVLVRHDLGDYRHLHPTLDAATGVWTTPVDLSAGSWRLYADVVPAGADEVVAETDLQVAGEFTPRPLPAVSDVARVDGYEVHLERDDARLAFHITRGGQEVTDLEPYLGAYGHLVAIRTDDLAYAHVHPIADTPGPELAFSATLAGPARHRLFLEFRHAGAVHRAELTVAVDAAAGHDEPHGPAHDHAQPESEGESGGHQH